VKIIEFGLGARADFDESFDWYAERSEAAATGFCAAIEHAFEAILTNPGRCSRAALNCQYYSLKRYPFRVIFRQDETRILIVAIAHAKREPDYWHRRIY
jgi:toxin ParE1/3/4